MNIIEAADLPEKEKIYLKKDMFGYRIVHPIKNPDGSINFANLLFGGVRNLMFLIFFFGILSFLIYAHYHDVAAIQQNYEVISSDPLAWCKDVCKGIVKPQYDNFTNFNFSILS